MTTFERVYAAVRLIPRGSVATYGQIARAIGNPRLARVVGYALHVNPEPVVIPCHRVVRRDGAVSPAFAFGGSNRQVELLKNEGVGLRTRAMWIWRASACGRCRTSRNRKHPAFTDKMGPATVSC